MTRLTELTKRDLLDLKATDAARYVACLGMNRGDVHGAATQFAQRFPASPHVALIERMVTKAGVPAAAPSTWGGALMPTGLLDALIQFSAPFSVVARLGAQRVPFLVKLPMIASDVTLGTWVAPGKAKPVGDVDFGQTPPLEPRKVVASPIVVTTEMIRLGTPSAATMLRDLLAHALAAFTDRQFCDPTIGTVGETRPASITSGLTPIVATGDPATDVAALVAAFVAGGGRLESATWLMSTANASGLKTRAPELARDLTASGGTLNVSPALASDSVGPRLILVDTARVLVADDGEGSVDASGQAALEMNTAPVSSGVAPVGAKLVSLWQNNLFALKAERFVNWVALPGSVQFMNVDYLAPVTP